MEIKTRQQAMAAGENKYFTGKECKHGHKTFRYVQSGACYDCINSSRINEDSPSAKARQDRLKDASDKMTAKNLILENMVVAKFRLFAQLRDTLALSAYAMAAVRFPSLVPSDIETGVPSGKESSGTALYAFYCHPDDVAALRTIENSLMRNDSDAIRRKIHGANADVPMAPVPDWARTPRPGDPDYK